MVGESWRRWNVLFEQGYLPRDLLPGSDTQADYENSSWVQVVMCIQKGLVVSNTE